MGFASPGKGLEKSIAFSSGAGTMSCPGRPEAHQKRFGIEGSLRIGAQGFTASFGLFTMR